jgi:hypothetical protein
LWLSLPLQTCVGQAGCPEPAAPPVLQSAPSAPDAHSSSHRKLCEHSVRCVLCCAVLC